MIVRIALYVPMVLALTTGYLTSQEEKPQKKDPNSHAGFEQFKLLAGDWVGKERTKDGRELHVRYKVTSGGSAVVETIFPGTEREMITVIHRDGADLLLTHYCMLGNQPQMKADGNGGGNKIAFKFVRATNLKSDKAMYMHDVTYTFVDKDTLKSEWTHYKDGKDSGHVVFELKRKK